MPTKKEMDATPSAVKVELDRLGLHNARLKADLKVSNAERDFAKTALTAIKNDYEARVSNTLKLDIQDVLKCSPKQLAELTHGKSVEELDAMLNHVMLARSSDPTNKDKSTYKPIRVDTGTPKYGDDTGLTVPNIFGKTPTQVREMMAGEQ